MRKVDQMSERDPGRCRRVVPKRALCAVISVVVSCLGTMIPLHEGSAATYYVDQSNPNASDTNPGTNETAPWRTLVRAMSVVAGDTVYVKSGTYSDSNTLIYSVIPAVEPVNSGQPGSPIAFRVSPGHSVTLGVSINVTTGNNYIVWDGFVVAPGQFIRVYGGDPQAPITGVVIENCTVQVGGIPTPAAGGTYNSIFLQNVSNSVIRNCLVRDTFYTDSTFENAAAIMMYGATGVIIEHNEFYNNNAAIFDKSLGRNNVFRYNFIRDSYNAAIKVGGIGCDGVFCGGQHIYQNVIYNTSNTPVSGAINVGSTSPTTTTFVDVEVFNNTLFNTYYGLLAGPTPNLKVYNNIVYASSGGGYFGMGQVGTYVAVCDFNDFYNGTNWFYNPTNTFYLTLSAWRSATGLDLNSQNVDPLFVGPLTGTPTPSAFRLQTTSPLLNAGRVNGVSAGAPVNMGAYITGAEVIGRSNDQLAPSAPTGLSVR